MHISVYTYICMYRYTYAYVYMCFDILNMSMFTCIREQIKVYVNSHTYVYRLIVYWIILWMWFLHCISLTVIIYSICKLRVNWSKSIVHFVLYSSIFAFCFYFLYLLLYDVSVLCILLKRKRIGQICSMFWCTIIN